MTELFRQKVINLLVKKKLLNKSFARNMLSWKHSGFSVDNSVWILARDDKARENLCQYIARHPVSLKKITYEPQKGKVLYHTKYNEYWKENVKLFTATDFIAELTQHLPPPKRKHMIRNYGLFSSRLPVGRQEVKVNPKKMAVTRSLVPVRMKMRLWLSTQTLPLTSL